MRKFINYEFDNGLATVMIDNPPVNSLTKPVSEELCDLFDELQTYETSDKNSERKKVEVVVLSSIHNKNVFVAGADIGLFLNLRTKEDGLVLSRFYHQVINKIADFERPVICAIDGLALGGGTELALACDFRVAGESAVFALTEVCLGVLPGGGGTQRLARLVGPGQAKKMIFTGERITAAEAFRIGLIEKLAPKGEALAEARKIALTILSNSPSAIKHAKAAINTGLDSPLSAGLHIEQESFGEVCEIGDQIEGARAFLEKSKPRFS